MEAKLPLARPYRGTIAYDRPDRAVRCDAGTGERHNPEYRKAKNDRLRAARPEYFRNYMREYMRNYRKRKRT
jgi:hypothetical protein